MSSPVLQSESQKRGLTLDPRTKLFMLVTLAVFVLGGAGGGAVAQILPVIMLMPYALLLLSGKWKWALFGIVAFFFSELIMLFVNPHLSGLPSFILAGSCAILMRFLPSILMAAYLMSTTTVSEFTAAMQRLHVSEKIIIPLSVMFRFFPTVADEASSINSAMRMRDIRFGGSSFSKTMEYRMVPLMTCCVKIGEELSAAALTRGLGGKVKRTNICEIGFRAPDFVFLALSIVPWLLFIADIVISGLPGVLL